MNGLMRTLPVSPPPVVGSVASNSGSAVTGALGVDRVVSWDGSPSALSVTLVTVPGTDTGLPASSMAWNEAATVGPPLLAGYCSPVSDTVPTKRPLGKSALYADEP